MRLLPTSETYRLDGGWRGRLGRANYFGAHAGWLDWCGVGLAFMARRSVRQSEEVIAFDQ